MVVCSATSISPLKYATNHTPKYEGVKYIVPQLRALRREMDDIDSVLDSDAMKARTA